MQEKDLENYIQNNVPEYKKLLGMEQGSYLKLNY